MPLPHVIEFDPPLMVNGRLFISNDIKDIPEAYDQQKILGLPRDMIEFLHECKGKFEVTCVDCPMDDDESVYIIICYTDISFEKAGDAMLFKLTFQGTI